MLQNQEEKGSNRKDLTDAIRPGTEEAKDGEMHSSRGGKEAGSVLDPKASSAQAPMVKSPEGPCSCRAHRDTTSTGL